MNWEKVQTLLKTFLQLWEAGDGWKVANSTIFDTGAGAILGYTWALHYPFHQKANFLHFILCLCGLFYKITHIVFWFCIQWACTGRESTRDHNWHCSAGRGAIVERLPLTHGDKRWIYLLSWWTALIWAIISCSIWINTANNPNFNSEEVIGVTHVYACCTMYVLLHSSIHKIKYKLYVCKRVHITCQCNSLWVYYCIFSEHLKY